ncbi:hypothetical protein LC608_18935 [Nostoc sp. XA010]|uniref:hypothetical protein n=1 Tax=Nostoc sp. XA010 TaxID=2780407 RepID=UPI001E426238|nr:hypothetical protein [Nostoc sp. XA010]MCC5659011.1 hypothetical protein [Nostoc sp. XA010]
MPFSTFPLLKISDSALPNQDLEHSLLTLHAHLIGGKRSHAVRLIAQFTGCKIFLPPIQHCLLPLAPNFNYCTVYAALFLKAFASKHFKT